MGNGFKDAPDQSSQNITPNSSYSIPVLDLIPKTVLPKTLQTPI
jgi:hypothetical protein